MMLPYPPSVNHYWRTWRGRVLVSARGRAYRQEVGALLFENRPRKPPAAGRIALSIDAFPPDRRRRDLDNLPKSLLDALQHASLYHDDSQIDILTIQRGRPRSPGVVAVRLAEFPLYVCPLCGVKIGDDFCVVPAIFDP